MLIYKKYFKIKFMLEKPEQGNIRSEDIEIVKNKKALERLRNDWSNEKPPRIVNGKDVEYKHNKYRMSWFGAVVGHMFLILESDLIPEEIKEEIENFIKIYTSDEFKKSPTKEEDVNRADSLIDKVLEILENKI